MVEGSRAPLNRRMAHAASGERGPARNPGGLWVSRPALQSDQRHTSAYIGALALDPGPGNNVRQYFDAFHRTG